MSPIAPGTLCLIVQNARCTVKREFVGLTCTFARIQPHPNDDSLDHAVNIPGHRLEPIAVLYFGEAIFFTSRDSLRPILPPGVDCDEKVDNDVQMHVI